MTAKPYTRAPLPFIGQKRYFLRHFRQILDAHMPGNGAGWVIIDAFGGSGLLAHTAKRCKPSAHVIYNDYDDYSTRIRHIADTNRLHAQLTTILQHEPRDLKLSASAKDTVCRAICAFDGFIDLDCLSSWILFSGKVAADLPDFFTKTMYNRIRLQPYPMAKDYLQGLEIVQEDYANLLARYTGNPKALLILDPPYVSTEQGMYRDSGYFGMVAFLRLMQLVRPPFVFFSSTRSEFPAWLEMTIREQHHGWERFTGYKTITVRGVINKGAAYDDNMIFKWT